MNNEIIKAYLQKFNDVANDLNNVNYYLYAVRVNNRVNNKDNNCLSSLTYDFFDSQMDKKMIKENVEAILHFTENKYLKDDETVYEEYKETNYKTHKDYIMLSELDFTDENIKNGTLPGLNPDNYKVQVFLNSINNSNQISSSEFRNFKGIKYTVFYGETLPRDNSEKHRLVIVNRGNPIYKPKSLLFTFDDDDGNLKYNPIKKNLIKIPFYPGMIIIDDLCIFINENIKVLFGFTEQIKALRDNKVSELENMFNEEEMLITNIKKFSNSGKNYNYFSTYDDERVNNIKNKDAKTIKELEKIGLKFENNSPIIENENDAEKLLGYICHVLKRDIYDENEISISLNNKRLSW